MSDIGSRERYGAKDVIVKPVSVISVVAIIYCMCCAGAFGIEEMIPEGGPGLTLVMLIVLPFVWALPYSYIVAELGSARPVEGGKLMWVKEAMGEFWFGIIVLVNFIWGLIANTVYVVLCVDYLGTKIPMDNYQMYVVKFALILIFFIVNLMGIKEVSWVSTVISIAVVCIFALIAIVGFSHATQSPFVPMANTAEASDFGYGHPVMAFGAALGLGIWMYTGFDEISMIGGEVKGAYKVIPKALVIAIPLIALTYILPTAGALSSPLGLEWEDWSTDPDGIGWQSVLELVGGTTGEVLSWVFVIVAILGNLSIYNVCIMTASRTTMILSDENLGPKSLAKLSKNRGMPWIALIIVIVVTTALLGTPNNPMEFTFLVLFDAFFGIVVICMVTAAAIILKRRLSPDEYKFKAPGGKYGFYIMIAFITIFVLCFAYLNGMDYFLGGLGIMLLFPILYCICKWIWKGASVKEPRLYPIDPRTKLGFGDLTRMGGYYLGFGIVALVGRVFLKAWEYEENSGYFVSPADIGVYEEWVMEDFPHLVNQNVFGEYWIPGYYEYSYTAGLFSNIDAMLATILGIGIAASTVGIILMIIGKRLKRNDERIKSEIFKNLPDVD